MLNLSINNFQHSLVLGIGFCLFMLAWHVFRNNKESEIVLDANSARNAEIDLLRAENHNILSAGKGKQGEDAVHQAIVTIFHALDIACITNRELHCPQAILPPTGNDKYSKEIDLLVISEIGVFVIEVKDWRGLWAVNEDNPQLLRKVASHTSQSTSNDRPAPLLKTQKKLTEVLHRSTLSNIKSDALVVFTDMHGNGHAQLPPNYLHLSELAYYFRQQATAFFEEIESEEDGEVGCYDIPYLVEQILPCLDSSPHALHHHMMRLSPNSDSLRSYQANHRRVVELEALPTLIHQSDRPFGYWVSTMLFYLSMAVVTQALN